MQAMGDAQTLASETPWAEIYGDAMYSLMANFKDHVPRNAAHPGLCRQVLIANDKRVSDGLPPIGYLHTKAHLSSDLADPANDLVDTAAKRAAKMPLPPVAEVLPMLEDCFHLMYRSATLSGNAVSQFFKAQRAARVVDYGGGRNAFPGVRYIDHNASVKLERPRRFPEGFWTGCGPFDSMQFRLGTGSRRVSLDRRMGKRSVICVVDGCVGMDCPEGGAQTMSGTCTPAWRLGQLSFER